MSLSCAELLGIFFRLRLALKRRGRSLKLHILLCVVPINKPTSSLPALSRLSKIMRRGLQSFNCIVRTTATYCFIKRPHIEQVTRKVNLFKTRKKPFSLSLLLTWHFNYVVLSDRCGDRAHVKVRAWPLLIFYYIFLYSDCRWESDSSHHRLEITQKGGIIISWKRSSFPMWTCCKVQKSVADSNISRLCGKIGVNVSDASIICDYYQLLCYKTRYSAFWVHLQGGKGQ